MKALLKDCMGQSWRCGLAAEANHPPWLWPADGLALMLKRRISSSRQVSKMSPLQLMLMSCGTLSSGATECGQSRRLRPRVCRFLANTSYISTCAPLVLGGRFPEGLLRLGAGVSNTTTRPSTRSTQPVTAT